MPYAKIVDKLASLITKDAVMSFDENVLESLRVPDSLLQLAEVHGDLTGAELDYLSAVPPALLEGVRAAMVVAIEAQQAVHLHFTPGYDFQVRLSDYGEALSIHLIGPYSAPFPRQSMG